jgi:hypothetical protein
MGTSSRRRTSSAWISQGRQSVDSIWASAFPTYFLLFSPGVKYPISFSAIGHGSGSGSASASSLQFWGYIAYQGVGRSGAVGLYWEAQQPGAGIWLSSFLALSMIPRGLGIGREGRGQGDFFFRFSRTFGLGQYTSVSIASLRHILTGVRPGS